MLCFSFLCDWFKNSSVPRYCRPRTVVEIELKIEFQVYSIINFVTFSIINIFVSWIYKKFSVTS